MVVGIIRATMPCMGRGVVLETSYSGAVSLSAGILRKKINRSQGKFHVAVRHFIMRKYERKLKRTEGTFLAHPPSDGLDSRQFPADTH